VLNVVEQCEPQPELRAALREALTLEREQFRAAVDRLAAKHALNVEGLAADPETVDLPGPVDSLTGPERRLTWRAWTLADAPIGVVVTGAAYHDNPILYANHATRRLTGYSLEALRGDNLRRLQGPRTDPAAVDALREALRNWNSTTVELRNYRADGTPFINRVSLVPVAAENGTVEHWFGLQAPVSDTL